MYFSQVKASVLDWLRKSIKGCNKEPCFVTYVRVARNFANPNLVPILLDLVESGKGAVVLEALKALQYQDASVSEP